MLLEEISFAHYGTKRHSGRYPWGSGDDPYQHDGLYFNQYVRERKNAGESEVDIARDLEMSVAELRSKVSISKAEKTAADRAKAIRMKDHGDSNRVIAEALGVTEGTVRNLLNPTLESRANTIANISDTIKKNVDEKGYIDVGPGTEIEVGVSRTKMNAAIAKLKEEGYEKIVIQQDQLGINNGQKTYVTVMCPPGTTYKDVVTNRDKIHTMEDYFVDNGKSVLGLRKPEDVSSDRVMIRYAEEGGKDKDGVIELRPGVKDLDLGKSHYAQVRISVDGTHYLKGMAMYSADEMPPGVDIIFNTNKHIGTDKMDVLKKQKKDPLTGEIDKDNPFGSNIKPGGQRGALNICREEGEWDQWNDRLASQFLSKQSPELAKRQINLSLATKKDEFEKIKECTNPAVKRKLLEAFASECDSNAVTLHAAALPRQSWKVILPIDDLKDNEIYAPTYNDGERVALVRYPHGGIFEIPELTVNNKNKSALKVMNNVTDAVGINSRVAERLSGADFDGDSVLVIPTRNVKIRTSKPLEGLKGFDPKESYPEYEGMKVLSNRTKQIEMGKVTNLITDMQIKGADADEIARAVRHSMVIIDAEKHHLNYKQSAIDNGIAALKKKYQDDGHGHTGASTLISRAGSEVRVLDRKANYKPDPETGAIVYKNTGKTYKKRDKDGNLVELPSTIKSTQMEEAFNSGKDAYSLSSGRKVEEYYAEYANQLKAMANQARLESLHTKSTPYSPSAAKTYAKEVEVLNAKLKVAQKNAPRERQAQNLAGLIYRAKLEADPTIKGDKDKEKKIRNQALADARDKMGVKKIPVTIGDREWEAIQSGAISNNMLTKIMNNTDLDALRKRATPKQSRGFSSSEVSVMRTMKNSGYTLKEIADRFGVSASTISSKLNE